TLSQVAPMVCLAPSVTQRGVPVDSLGVLLSWLRIVDICVRGG
ncbi:unnamed protein product, partial [marine sediment metagenome]